MNNMTIFLITLRCLFLVVLFSIGVDIYLDHFCRHYGTKMNRYYDVEEDSEVYQCPKCGRSYLIK